MKILIKIISIIAITTISSIVRADFAYHEKVQRFNIPQQSADLSLIAIATQADLTLMFPYESVKLVMANAINGKYSAIEAINLILDGTELQVSKNDRGVLTVDIITTKSRSIDMNKSKLSTGILAALSSTIAFSMNAQELTQNNATDLQAKEEQVEVITVTGFRGSLNKALADKRMSVNSKESIHAEDIGKFPDLNIAESLQRVPGVAISREGGEGRNITLRGFAPSFTRTTLNGMEVPAGSDGLDSGGVTINSSRAFDFNIFASELFNRVDIQKTTTASMEEGGIAGTVDLYSGKPFDYDGFSSSFSVQDGYNSLTEKHDPRLTFMVSDTFADETFGALFSAAYSERTVRQEGFGTVRWTTPVITGNTYPTTSSPIINGDIKDQDCALNGEEVDPINCLWLPRLPRADFFGNDQKRLGLTGSFQYRPASWAEITFDALYSKLDNNRRNYNSMEWFLTHNEITPLEITVAENGTDIQSAVFDDVESWIESRDQVSKSEFLQFVLSGEFNLSDDLTLSAMLGSASNQADRREVRFYYVSQSHQYSFDFSDNANIPKVSWGEDYDYYDPANYTVNINQHRSHDVKKDNLTAKLDLTYEGDDFTIKTGLAYNDREVDYREGQGNRPDAVNGVGYTTDFPYDNFGDGLSGSGLTPFPVADFNAIYDDLIIEEYTDNKSATWIVGEETLAIYLEMNSIYEIGHMELRTNFGIRYVDTNVSSSGYFNDEMVTIDRSYGNFLPSMNLALDITEDVVARMSYGRSMTRPSLGSLNIASPNFTYETRTVGNLGNPALDPYQSNDFDIGVEWYFQEEALFAITYFSKDVETSLETVEVVKLIDEEYWDAIYADPRYDESYGSDPATVPYSHYIPVNDTEGFKVEGYEVIYQQPFSFLPGMLKNFGIVTNYTHVSAGDMTGMSENSYNFTFYYEQEQFGARVSANTRDDYLISAPGGNGHLEEMKYGPTHIDFSSFYNITENLTVTFEVINLTDEEERIYGTGEQGTQNLTREYNHTGTQFFLGARYTM